MYNLYTEKEKIPAELIIPNFILKDRAAAEEFLSLASFPAAVAFYEDVTDSEEALAIIEKIKKMEERLAAYIEEKSVRNFQAKNIGCRNCESSLAREYLKSDICPVCGSDLRVQSVVDGETQQRQKIAEMKKALELQRDITKLKTANVLWLSDVAEECCDCGCGECHAESAPAAETPAESK